MMLSGKAKEDFKEFLYNKYDVFYKLKDYHKTMLYAEIIDWFDSVGIYIEVYRHNNRPTVQGFNSRIVRRINGYYECCTAVDTRNKAIQYAIEKANEIYNNKN